MRLLLVGVVALTCMVGCGRLGFGLGEPNDHTLGVSPGDGGTTHGVDAAVVGKGAGFDARALDASVPNKPITDAAVRPASAGAAAQGTAGTTALDASSAPNDGAVPGSMTDGQVPGSNDAATGDAAVDGGLSALCPERPGALFCDGFEDPMFSRWDYSLFPNGALERNTTRVHSGTGSLRATTNASSGTNSGARYGVKAFAHQKSGDIWVRYYYYLPSSVVLNAAFSTGVVSEVEQPYFGFALLALPSEVDIAVGSTFYRGTSVFPRDHWTCVELHVQIDASAGVFEAYLDNAIAARAVDVNTLPARGYTSLDVGIHYTDPSQAAVEVFVDDVVAANTRVGCN